jgi:serine/threonine-protein kinase
VPQPPRLLGPYEVGAKIAGGGMATVFLGRKLEGGEEKVVALKVIKDELANDETFIHMFLDEAKILSRLSHPNIIETLEYGVTGEHRFIAMELLLGRSLADVWDLLASKGARVPRSLGAWICARVADGLEHAHTLKDDDGQLLNVIHRDVNPSNIFLTFDGRVKLIDFGLAKMKNRRAKTGDGIVKGKVPYLSPEQITQETIDGRTDLYSLGTTLWELGTGKRLFKRDSDIETIDAIRQAKVADARGIVHDYPNELWEILQRSLQPEPSERFATAGDVARALDRFLEDKHDEIGATKVESFLAELFPGDHARQTAWLRLAKSRGASRGAATVPPPVPLPEVQRGAGEARDTTPTPTPTPAPLAMPKPEKKLETTNPETPKAKSKTPPPVPKRPKATAPAPESVADRKFWFYASLVFVVALVVAAFTMR